MARGSCGPRDVWRQPPPPLGTEIGAVPGTGTVPGVRAAPPPLARDSRGGGRLDLGAEARAYICVHVHTHVHIYVLAYPPVVYTVMDQAQASAQSGGPRVRQYRFRDYAGGGPARQPAAAPPARQSGTLLIQRNSPGECVSK